MKQIRIEDLGPITNITLPLDDSQGGVALFVGPCGSGKSTALRGVARLLGDSKQELSVRDGAPSAYVEGLDVRVTVGRTTQRRGTLSVRQIDGVDPSKLVNPGFEKPERNDEERIRAVVRMCKTQLTIDDFAKDLYGETLDPVAASNTLRSMLSHKSNAIEDPIDLAASIKRDIQGHALRAREQGKQELAQVDGLRASIADVDLRRPCDEAALAANLRTCSATEARLKLQRASWISKQAAAERAAEILQGTTEEALVEERNRLEELVKDRIDDVTHERSGVVEAEEALRKAKELLAEALREQGKAQQALATHDEKRRLMSAALKDQLDFAEAVEVTEEKVLAASAERAEAEQDLSMGGVVRRAIEQAARADKANVEGNRMLDTAVRLYELADAVDDTLSRMMQAIAPRGLQIKNGRLVMHTDRGLEVFSDLSEGERWSVALDIAIDAHGEGNVFTIPQEAWAAMGKPERDAVAAHCWRRKTWIVTAEISDGPLSVAMWPVATEVA